MEEFEDEGISFFVQLEDMRVLFLSGQYLYEVDEHKQFPSTAFTVERTVNSGLVLDFRCDGAYFPPSYRRDPFTESEHKQGIVPTDGEIVDIQFEALRPSSSP